jgi:hypothetical protein
VTHARKQEGELGLHLEPLPLNPITEATGPGQACWAMAGYGPSMCRHSGPSHVVVGWFHGGPAPIKHGSFFNVF